MPQRLIDHPKRFWTVVTVTLLAIVASVGISVWAITTAKGAPDQAARKAAADNASLRLTDCQVANRNRPQIAINSLVAIDGILKINPKITIEIRRQVAQAQIDALGAELGVGRSIGFRDCDQSGRIDRGDFLPAEPPPEGWDVGRPELLGPDRLPHVKGEMP